jgi:hypothetical protein
MMLAIAAFADNSSAQSSQSNPPAGWQQYEARAKHGATAYQSPDRALLAVFYGKPPTGQSAKSWLEAYADKRASGLKIVSRTKAAQDNLGVKRPDFDAAFLNMSLHDKKGRTDGNVTYAAIVRPGKPVQIVSVLQLGPTKHMRRHFDTIEKLLTQSRLPGVSINDARSMRSYATAALSGRKETAKTRRAKTQQRERSATRKSVTARTSKRTTRGRARSKASAVVSAKQAYAGLKELRIVKLPGGHRGSGVNRMYVPFKYKTIAVFKDGTYTGDLGSLQRLGRERSVRQRPKRWGQWRMKGKKFLMRKPGSRKFTKVAGSWRAKGGRSGTTLNRCYARLKSSSAFAGSINVHSVSRYCFTRKGTFSSGTSTNTSVAAIGDINKPTQRPSAGSHSRSGNKSGRYEIRDQLIHFYGSDGRQWWSTFTFLGKDSKVIVIDGQSWT